MLPIIELLKLVQHLFVHRMIIMGIEMGSTFIRLTISGG